MDKKEEKKNQKNILDIMKNIDEFYCLEDFYNFNMVHSCKTFIFLKENINPENYIAVTFFKDNREKQLIQKKIQINKIYFFIRIYFQNHYINLLINRKEKIDGDEILKKINNIELLRSPIKFCLKIFEFPLEGFLEEKNEAEKDNNYDKIYQIKSLSQTSIIFKFIDSKKNNKICQDNKNEERRNNTDIKTILINNNFIEFLPG